MKDSASKHYFSDRDLGRTQTNKIAFSRIKISSRTIDKINWCGCLFLRNNIELMMCNPVCQPLS